MTPSEALEVLRKHLSVVGDPDTSKALSVLEGVVANLTCICSPARGTQAGKRHPMCIIHRGEHHE